MNQLTIKHSGGREFTTLCRGHKVVCDQPLDNGGKDNGPTPTELFISSLGFCIGVYIEGFCKRGGVPYEGMELEIKWERSKDPNRISKIDVDVKMPEEISEERKKAVLKVAGHCLIHNTITHHAEVRIKLQ